VDDTQGYARLATHLNSKKAGPLVCPICRATESFEAKGALAGSRSGPRSGPLPATDLAASAEPLASAEPRFGYAACTNCGYSIFFEEGALPLPE
jgi:predicted nucleic-acid-binding Zn-ribbon protein